MLHFLIITFSWFTEVILWFVLWVVINQQQKSRLYRLMAAGAG